MHKSILTHLTEFRETIKFSQLNYDLIVEFDNWLRLRKYHQNTIRNHHKTVKAYINKAIKSGIIPRDQYPYENFKLKEIKSTRKGITNEEQARIEELKLSFNEMEVVKDMFLFSCFAGLRFSDMRNLKKENVNIAADDQLTIAFTMQKTSTHIKLPLSYLFNGKPAEIIRKYYKDTDNTYIFPRYSNQHVNRILKLIATLADIEERLTFHISRHTFCSQLAEIHPDPYLIKELAGHSDIKISMIYIHQSNAVIENKLKNIDWK